MKSILFCRVSSKEQEDTGYSLPAQEKLLNEYSGQKNFTVDKVFSISESASGKKKRQAFNEMLKYVKKNNIKIIICEKIDRLTRNLKDAVEINDWINGDPEREVHFVKEGVILNKDSKSNEKFIWNIKVSVAQYYIDNLSEEVRKGQKEKIEQGWLPTRPPIGYKSVGEQGHRIHIIDENKVSLVKKMFELYSSGNYSVKRLTGVMNEMGLRNDNGNKIVKSRMHQYLTDPFYIGYNEWNKQLTLGKQETFIDDSLFEKVQKLLKSKTTPKYSKHNHLFKGCMRCKECEGTITWEIQKGIVYGHCNHYRNCTQTTWVIENDINKQLMQSLGLLQLKSMRLSEWIRKALKETHKDEIAVHSSSVSELTKRQVLLKQRLDKLYDDKLDDKISEDFYQRKYEEYSAELRNLDKSLSKVNNASLSYFELSLNFYDLSQRSTEIYNKASIEEKRSLIKVIFDSLTIDNGVLEWNYSKPFKMLYDAVQTTNSSKLLKDKVKEVRIFEPEEKVDITGQSDTFMSLRPTLLPLIDTLITIDYPKLSFPSFVDYQQNGFAYAQ